MPDKLRGRGERGDPQGRGGERRADPCDHEPQGNAHGRDKLCPSDGGSGGVARGDFNFDGYGDLAIGVPDEDLDSGTDAGAVHIIYGSPAGLSATAGPGDQFWTAAKIAAEGGEAVSTVVNNYGGNKFGFALASGKFNGDEYSDLAIGVPFERVDGVYYAGAVQVLYGSAAGLTSAGSQVLEQGRAGLADTPEEPDRFGSVLNWGDFNRDGYGDLAVGVPAERIGTLGDAGAVHVIYGSPAGLTGENDRLWTQDSEGILDAAEVDDRFGAALAAGDFNGDGTQDLAVGVPEEDVGPVTRAGAVQVLYGSPSEGLTATGDQLLHQDTEGVLDAAETFDKFGSALAAGRFNGGAHDDLAVGVPFEDVGTVSNAGAVNIIYGSAAGLTSSGNQIFTQNSQGVQDIAEANDGFGSALAAGDFNGDTLKDLAIGVPLEDVADTADAGAVHVIYGSVAGIHARLFPLSSPDAFREPVFAVFPRFLTQRDATGGLNFEEEGDRFGSSLTAWDFGFQPGVADLVIGVPDEDLGDIFNAGAVAALYGVATPGADTGALVNPQHWTQDSEGIEDQAEAGDQFGRALY